MTATDSHSKELAVLLFTDIVGSVALQSKLGTEAYTRFISRHDALFKQCLSHVSGARILNETGDGFLVKFGSASDAVETALRLQCLLRNEVCEGEPMQMRIGLHMGEVSEMEEQITGDKRAVGMAINLCARIMDLARDRQILLTRAVFDEARQYTREHPLLEGIAREELPPLQWPAHGRYLFKGTEEPMDIYEVGALGWAPLTPPDDNAKAKRAVSAEEEATLGWRPGAGLPIPRHEKWVITEKLGQGGFGEVWLATHADTKNQRVFKFCFDAERLRSFKRELTLFRLLRDALGNRDDIAALYDVSVEAPPFYLESQYVPLGNLSIWAEAQGGIDSVPMTTRLDLLARAARALAAAHSVGIIHKDIKPSNILIHEEDGAPRPRIADFGIGTLADSAALDQRNITQLGFTESLMGESDGGSSGTQLYMAPEYLIGQPASIRGDVFSLGVMLYQLVAGDLTKPMGSGWHRDVEDPLLREDIARCIDVDPNRRFADATDLAVQLETLAERHAALRREEEAAAYQQRLQQQTEKRRRLLALGAVAMVGLLAVVASLYKGLQEQRVLKESARITASQADYALANEHLKQGYANMAVAHLARALRSDPDNASAARRLVATLGYHRFPRRAFPPLDLEIRMHEDIETADMTSDGAYVAGFTKNGGVEIFELASGRSLHGVLLEDPQRPITGLYFNRAADHLLVMREKSYQRVRVSDGVVVGQRDLVDDGYGHNHVISQDRRYWIGYHVIEAKVHVQALEGDQEYVLPDPKGQFSLYRYHATPDGRYLAAFWETDTKGLLSVVDLHAPEPAWKEIFQGPRWTGDAPSAPTDVDPTGQRIAFGVATGEVVVLDIATGDRLHTFTSANDFVMVIAFSPEGERLGVGRFSGSASVHSLATGERVVGVLEHDGSVIAIDFNRDGSQLLTGSLDATARLWDLDREQEISQPMVHGSQVLYAGFDDSSQRALTLSLDGACSVWDLTRYPIHVAPLSFRDDLLLAASPDHQRFVTANREAGLQQITADRSLHQHQPGNGEGDVAFCAYRGGDFITWRRQENHGLLERLRADGTQETLSLPSVSLLTRKVPFRVLDYHSGNEWFLGGSSFRVGGELVAKEVEVRSWHAPETVVATLAHETPATMAYFAPSGRFVFTATANEAFVWDLDAPTPQKAKLGMSLIPTCAAMAVRKPMTLIGSITGDVQLWDLDQKEARSNVLRHDGPVFLLAMDDEATTGVTLSFTLAGEFRAQLRAWNLTDSTPITKPISIPVPHDVNFNRRPQFGNGFLSLSQDRTRVLVCLGEDTMQVDLYPEEGSPPASLSALAEGIAGFAVDETSGQAKALAFAQQETRLREVDGMEGGWAAWANWLTASSSERSIAPGSEWTLSRYVDYLRHRDDSVSLRRALGLSPGNPRVLAALAAASLKGDHGKPHLALAEFYVMNAMASVEQLDPADQEGLEEAFCSASEVCLQLGIEAARKSDIETARKHFHGALVSAQRGYARDPEHADSRVAMALAYYHLSSLGNASTREAYLDAAFMILALLRSEGVQVETSLEAVMEERWPEGPGGEVLIAPGSSWHYQTAPAADVSSRSLVDASHWREGTAPIGYGDDFLATHLDISDEKPLVVHFRKTVILPEALPETPAVLKMLYDDGATVFLNGQRLWEANMRDGKVLQTLPSAYEGTFDSLELYLPPLEAGSHTFAVSVHQVDAESSDLSFDCSVMVGVETVASRWRTHSPDTIEALVAILGEAVLPSWAEHWHFYHAEVPDGTSPLAQSPSAFCQRAFVQQAQGQWARARAAAQASIRLTAKKESRWSVRAEEMLKDLPESE